MFGKPLNDLVYDDIDNLVNIRQEREGYQLDFKTEIGNPDKAKKEISKDITSFANSGGGYLIFGVDKFYNIVGTSKIIQNRDVDEWLNQVLSSNIEPSIFYFDPKIIPIPESDKVVVVIYIPESTKKPHIVTEWNNYFIRINDSSKTANHSQIRDMFEFSRRRAEDFDEFMKKRNLFDEDSEFFGLNKNSERLYNDNPNKVEDTKKPIVLFSLIPKLPKETKFKGTFKEFYTWLSQNNSGYEPVSNVSLYFPNNNYETKIDGIVFKRTDKESLFSYFEVLENGFVECGLSSTITYAGRDSSSNDKLVAAIYLNQIIGYEMMFLGFAKKFFEYIKYYDDILFQLSFVNVGNYKLYGFHDKYRNMHRYESSSIKNKQHQNFKLSFNFNAKSLDNYSIKEIAMQHSERICRAFGLDKDYCFDENGDINLTDLYHGLI